MTPTISQVEPLLVEESTWLSALKGSREGERDDAHIIPIGIWHVCLEDPKRVL